MEILSWSEIGRMFPIALLCLGGISIGVMVRVIYDYAVISELIKLIEWLLKELSKND